MTYFLYGLAVFFGLAPFAVWAYLVLLGCAYGGGGNCAVALSDYLDAEFLTLAVFPWAIGLICVAFARRMPKR